MPPAPEPDGPPKRSAPSRLAAVWRGPYWWLLVLAALLLPAALVYFFVTVQPEATPFTYTPL
jgi:hypothetical protein